MLVSDCMLVAYKYRMQLTIAGVAVRQLQPTFTETRTEEVSMQKAALYGKRKEIESDRNRKWCIDAGQVSCSFDRIVVKKIDETIMQLLSSQPADKSWEVACE